MAAQNLTEFAQAGFIAQLDEKPAASVCPHYTCSPAGMAWLVGAWLKKIGGSAPRDVCMSRGFTVRADNMLVSVADAFDIQRVQ